MEEGRVQDTLFVYTLLYASGHGSLLYVWHFPNYEILYGST